VNQAQTDTQEQEERAAQIAATRWAISLEWFPEHRRSISALLRDYLCPECARRFADDTKAKPEALIGTIQKCCSQQPDFINERLPIMESAFRLLLSHGNKAMELGELSRELGERRGGDTYRTSPEALLRILKKDGYYGLQPLPEKSTG
jgi:hypothetical protein